MADPFEGINFLIRSENRVAVLETLADEPRTERELVDAAGVTDVTAGRVLEDFQQRGWINADGDTYATTRLGDILAEDYERLANSMEVARRLGPVRDLLPVEQMDFDLRRLGTARITDPDDFDALRTLNRSIDLLRQADRVAVLMPVATAVRMLDRAIHEEVLSDNTEFEAILPQNYLRTLEDRPALRELYREMARSGAELYRTTDPSDFEFSVGMYDDLAAIAGFDENGTLRVGIESRDELVYQWVQDTYETHRANATQLTPEAFTD